MRACLRARARARVCVCVCVCVQKGSTSRLIRLGSTKNQVLRFFTAEFQKHFVHSRKWFDAEFFNVTNVLNVVLIWDLSG